MTGGRAVLHPIAGTRKRGDTPERDAELAAELVSDVKERAEHVMLVDLARNDLGRVCAPGTVRVVEFGALERYSHVWHIVSTVTGEVAAGRDALDVLTACFPAGTLTGAPKVRAMEIIDELEPVRRGVYGGAVGYLDAAGDLDMAIAIRTAVIRDGTAYVQASAGIVADSDPGRRGAGDPQQGPRRAPGPRHRRHPHPAAGPVNPSDRQTPADRPTARRARQRAEPPPPAVADGTSTRSPARDDRPRAGGRELAAVAAVCAVGGGMVLFAVGPTWVRGGRAPGVAAAGRHARGVRAQPRPARRRARHRRAGRRRRPAGDPALGPARRRRDRRAVRARRAGRRAHPAAAPGAAEAGTCSTTPAGPPAPPRVTATAHPGWPLLAAARRTAARPRRPGRAAAVPALADDVGPVRDAGRPHRPPAHRRRRLGRARPRRRPDREPLTRPVPSSNTALMWPRRRRTVRWRRAGGQQGSRARRRGRARDRRPGPALPGPGGLRRARRGRRRRRARRRPPAAPGRDRARRRPARRWTAPSCAAGCARTATGRRCCS